MNACAKTAAIALLILLSGWFFFAGSSLAACAAVRRAKTTITSKRTKAVVITITNADGKLREGENSFCVAVDQSATGEPVVVQRVSVDFRLLVGRIQEKPIRAQLKLEQAGRYCGQVDLGKQYYIPASYYAFVSYTEAGGCEKRARLSLSVK